MLLLSISSYAQVMGIVLDSITGKPIPYLNILVEGGTIGTSSNEQGKFELNDYNLKKRVVFSGIGYATKRMVLNKNGLNNVILTPEAIELAEVVLNSNKVEKKRILGQFKKSKINKFKGGFEKPKIRVRYFAYDSDYEATPFLKKIKFFAISDVKEAVLNLRFYKKNEDGSPGDYLYDKNIIITAQRGRKYTEVDLLSLHIRFPENGFFIAFEWLFVEQNKYEYMATVDGQRKKVKSIGYAPSIGSIPKELDGHSWEFVDGNWIKVKRNSNDDFSIRHRNKFDVLAMELTLSN